MYRIIAHCLAAGERQSIPAAARASAAPAQGAGHGRQDGIDDAERKIKIRIPWSVTTGYAPAPASPIRGL